MKLLFSNAFILFTIQLITSDGAPCLSGPYVTVPGYDFYVVGTMNGGAWKDVNEQMSDEECGSRCDQEGITCKAFMNSERYSQCQLFNAIYPPSLMDWTVYGRVTYTKNESCGPPPTPAPTLPPTPPPTPTPTAFPTTTPTQNLAGAGGDPHIKTWTGEQYDFHGVCDLVILSNLEFQDGHGMNIHIRNMRYGQVWSYISTIAVSIGENVLQIMGGRNSMKYFLNGILKDAGSNNSDSVIDDFSGYKLMFKRTSNKAVEYKIILDNAESILLKTWNRFVSVSVRNPRMEHFGSSVGLMGSFPNGIKLARDNVTIISDSNMFGQEWQVIGSDPKLFVETEGPQFPNKCNIPSSNDMRRRLENSIVTIETAKAACAGINKQDKELCIFDVMATNDIGFAGAY